MSTTPTARLGLIGCGAIGSAVLDGVRSNALLPVTQIVTADAPATGGRHAGAPQARLLTALELDAPDAPTLLVECAGHAAVEAHVLPALRRGIPVVLASIGALHDATLLAALSDAAVQGGARVHLVPGAVGAIDALAAAKLSGLTRVQYTGRKPPRGWAGTPAAERFDLAALSEAEVIFEGSARDAARLYPKNANVAATVSLAGIGLDATEARLIADPAVTRNVHQIVAEGSFGRFEFRIENEPLPSNPKTSALTVFSILRAIHNATAAVAI